MRPLVSFWIHCHAWLQHLMHRMEERWTGLIWTYSNECVFEALHVVSFVTTPPGPAVDGLSGFLARGGMACALGLVHNHLLCLSDHSLCFCLVLYCRCVEVFLRILKGKHRTRRMDQVWVQGCPKTSAEWMLPVVHADCYNRLRQSIKSHPL